MKKLRTRQSNQRTTGSVLATASLVMAIFLGCSENKPPPDPVSKGVGEQTTNAPPQIDTNALGTNTLNSSGRPFAVTSDEFEQVVLKSELLVLVEFGAEWLGPGEMLAPVIDEIAQEHAGKLVVCKVDIDDGILASQYGIASVPTWLIFKDGKRVEKIVGFKSKKHLVSLIKKHL